MILLSIVAGQHFRTSVSSKTKDRKHLLDQGVLGKLLSVLLMNFIHVEGTLSLGCYLCFILLINRLLKEILFVFVALFCIGVVCCMKK